MTRCRVEPESAFDSNQDSCWLNAPITKQLGHSSAGASGGTCRPQFGQTLEVGFMLRSRWDRWSSEGAARPVGAISRSPPELAKTGQASRREVWWSSAGILGKGFDARSAVHRSAAAAHNAGRKI